MCGYSCSGYSLMVVWSTEGRNTPSPPTKSFPTRSPWVKLSGRLPIQLYGHENSHPLEFRVCLRQTLWNIPWYIMIQGIHVYLHLTDFIFYFTEESKSIRQVALYQWSIDYSKHKFKVHGDFYTLSQCFIWITILLFNQLAEFWVAYFRVVYFPAKVALDKRRRPNSVIRCP